MKIIEKIEGKEIDLVLKKYCKAIPEKGWVPKFVYNIMIHNTENIIGECEARIGNTPNLLYNGHIGYAVNPEYRGNGYAGKAVELLLKVCRENNLEKVYITNSHDNISSKRVCEKLGAKFLGEFELPPDNPMRIEDGETHKNVFEINLK